MAGSVQGNGLANRTYNPSSSSTNLMGIFDSVTAAAQPQKPTESEYDMRVTQFLEQTKGDNDYEEKVRKFLEETAKWKKEQRIKEKKKRKKEKKSKEKLKKKKREEKRKRKLEEKKLKEQANEFRAKTGLAALGVSELQSIQSKISEFYSRMNKPPSPTPVKKKDSVEKPSKKPKLDHSSSSSDEATGGDKSPPRASKTGASNVKRSSNSKRAETPQGKQATRPRSRSSSGDRKKVDIFADSPSPQSKDRTEALSGSKFKMQINSNKIKKDTKTEKEVWSNDEDGEDDRDRDGRHYNEKKKERSPPPPKVMNVGVDKLSGWP
ncbi:DNA ligase 1 [Diaphorina citri]|uniref:DNA ligase 1 n=2 Tax=Diaphorina citri TaxID=121845 RepID=A0A3Q0JH52_DIACI|nr:DNA ligase 1 [Diaphorina citri]